ncbi:RNA polymerase sigma factor [Lysinibacillus odysseyi]|uniref:RNA polymerase sigma factor n=1 Tax=Lysinibacillus odysseyi 34hs-1 = NBRC 100172 TaxID=1220589 RepID=A0A0A3IL55_9BACI|nr:RNA polymerase sigma factor [Lysinibacillus odysseyi]KGR85484.1 RNA polymerase sigma factor [Lysinibacillus odysseyi 34hs-1 = NBRC 100172]
MSHHDKLTSYLLEVGGEVFRFLISKGAAKEDAEDIIQNTFYKVYTMIDALEESNLRAWFYRVALNEFIDLKRKKHTQHLTLSMELQEKLADVSNPIEKILQQDEIISLLKNVKPTYQEIFILKYYYDLSYEEIGELLQLQVENVKKKLYRARKTIQSEVGGIQKWINRFKRR